MKTSIYSYSLEDLTKIRLARGQTAYRSKQIYSWLYKKGVTSFDDRSDISKTFREKLKEEFDFALPEVSVRQKSKDGTVKCLFRLSDGEQVEGVLRHYIYGYSVCVSSEVGCNRACAFCASGLLKKKRNLTSAERLGQVLYYDKYVQSITQGKEHVTHVVVRGTGEPFDNYDNVLSFVKTINSPFGINIGARHITISTCGIVPGILKLAKEGRQINLAISLHAPTDELRNELMPINRAYPLEELIPAIIQFEKQANRTVTFEYIRIKNVNDSLDYAKKLFDLIYPTHGFVNLIPYNPVRENGFERSPDKNVDAFHHFLLDHGVKSTIRKEFGSDIDAACGQLRAKYGKQ